MKKVNLLKYYIKKVMFFSLIASVFTLPIEKVNAGNTGSVMLSSNTAVLPRPSVIPQPLSLPTTQTLPTTICPFPPIVLPRERSKFKPQNSVQCPNKKDAADRWREISNRDYRGPFKNPPGKGPRKPDDSEHHPNGHSGNRKPHFQTDKNKLKPGKAETHIYYPKTVTIAPGDSLWKISQKYGLDCKKLQSLNGIKDPTKLRPGQVIKLG